MLLFCAHFANGILSRDLKDACKILGFPDDWLVSLAYISLSSKPNFVDTPDAFDTFKSDVKKLINNGKSELQILSDCRKAEQVTTNDILSISDTKTGDRKELLLLVDQTIRGLMDFVDESGVSLYEQKINVLRYYSFLFEAVLKKNQQHHYYWESIVECTMLNSNSAAWKCKILEHIDMNSYVFTDEVNSSEIQDIIRNHDTNIRVLMNDNSSALSLKEGFNYLMRLEGEKREKEMERFFIVFQSFLMPLWTICKIHEYYEIALDYIDLYRQLNSTEYSQNSLIINTIKTELFACDVLYKKLKKSRDYCSAEDITQIEVQFGIVKKHLQKCPSEEW